MKKSYVIVILICFSNCIHAAESIQMRFAKGYLPRLVQRTIKSKMYENNIQLTEKQIIRLVHGYCFILKNETLDTKLFVLDTIDL